MSDAVLHGATYEDLLRVPDHLVAELIDGELFTSPRPASPHAWSTGAIYRRIFPVDGTRGAAGWWVLIEPELHLGRDVLVPDLAGWRRERMPFIPNVAAFDLAPDWVCEVVSPSTQRLDRVRKLPKYADADVGHAWLVDPLRRTVDIFRLDDGKWTVAGFFEGDDVIHAEPFETIDLDLGAIWLPTPPDPQTGR